MKIDKNVIVVEQDHGSREVSETTYRFRYDPASQHFILIGFDYAERDRVNGKNASESTNYLTGEDLFVIAEQINSNRTVYFRVFVKPLVNLIWLAGLVFLLGSLIALWPDAREERRLALRYREAGVGVPAR